MQHWELFPSQILLKSYNNLIRKYFPQFMKGNLFDQDYTASKWQSGVLMETLYSQPIS